MSEIKKRIQFYTNEGQKSQSIQSIDANEKLSQQSSSGGDIIDIQQLAGLQFYNMAVKSYNQNDFIQVIQNLEKGIKHYDSDRFQKFLTILLDNIAEDPTIHQSEVSYYTKK